jgi:hypothetical protein
MPQSEQLVHCAPLLMITAQQEEDLRLKRVTLTICIEIGEKRIFLKHFQKDFSVERWLKHTGEGRFADSNDPFDGNVHERAPMVKSRFTGWRP